MPARALSTIALMDSLPVKLGSRVRQAIQFAAIRHKDQKDKAGKPYIAHCFRVALAVWHLGEDHFIAAMLHDTVEDTATTLDEIENLFGKNVRNAVDSVSRRETPKKESYEDFVLRSKADPSAAWSRSPTSTTTCPPSAALRRPLSSTGNSNATKRHWQSSPAAESSRSRKGAGTRITVAALGITNAKVAGCS